jgi:hypothetical protein
MAEVSVGIQLGNVSLGFNLPQYPELVRVPGYPVYYAPRLNSNYFFYDGMYWVYQSDSWYSSSWYNGPWMQVDPEVVPVFILRVPVRYYRQPPAYFHSWQQNAAPRWGDHWGNSWSQRRSGWDQWNRRSVPVAAPLPVYQQQYTGDRYPRAAQQQSLQSRNYRYQAHDPLVRQYESSPQVQRPVASPQHGSQIIPQKSENESQRALGLHPPSQAQPVPRVQQPQNREETRQRVAPAQPAQQIRTAPVQPQIQPLQPGSNQHQTPEAKPRGEGDRPGNSGAAQKPDRGQDRGQDNKRDKPDERGQDRQR